MTTRPFPEFVSEAVRVVPFQPRHLTEQYVAWLNDPEVVRFSEQRHRTHTLETCRGYAESQWASSNYFLAVETADGSRHVGNIGVLVDRPNRLADVSIVIGDRSVWGSGLATRAWCATLDALTGPLEFRKVIAGTMEVNQPMLRLMERSGMRVEAIVPRYFVWEGRQVGLVLASTYGAEPAGDERHG